MTPLPAIATALPIGIAFGFLLERAGLGDPRRILGQLVLRDFTVLRVMFGAIITAMLALRWSAAMGWLDIAGLATPPTDPAAQVVGAVIFGGGFALAALCPGTACVAAASGRRDGLAAVVGVFLGTLVTPLLWPALGLTAVATPLEGARLPADFGWMPGIVVLGITFLGVGSFMAARRVEVPAGGAPWWHLRSTETAAIALASGLALLGGRPTPVAGQLAAIAGEIAREEDHVDPLVLAAWIKERRPGLRIIDVREGIDSSAYIIPGAEVVDLKHLGSLAFDADQSIVLYSDGGTHAAQAWVLLRTLGITNLHVLKDGMAAWEDEVLSPLAPAADADEATRLRFEQARALSLWFGGRPRRALTPANGAPAPAATPKPRRRRNTC
jgi:rhodanese-related sulfurtransferase/uncharacterized membrane protein YedE/YeeE